MRTIIFKLNNKFDHFIKDSLIKFRFTTLPQNATFVRY